MAININNLNNSNAVNQKMNQAQVKQESAQQSSQLTQTNVRQDSVSLTPQAQKMADLQKKASDEPQVNQKKIEQLKLAILSGDYKIDPEKLAANIVKFEFELS